MTIAVALAVAALALGFLLQLQVMDLQARATALETHRDNLQSKLDRVVSRRERRPQGHAVSLAPDHKFAPGDRVSFRGVPADPAWGEGVITHAHAVILCICYEDQQGDTQYALRPPAEVRLLAVVMTAGAHPFEEHR